jgi:hypothetical protein
MLEGCNIQCANVECARYGCRQSRPPAQHWPMTNGPPTSPFRYPANSLNPAAEVDAINNLANAIRELAAALSSTRPDQ